MKIVRAGINDAKVVGVVHSTAWNRIRVMDINW